ncbi:hypothetical protein CMUS01_13817 [Colletotrichum musicola]|uniref:Uncharacterized protein n=1 Tax=Colletotrichum musicola TaxID=2175873 RepID=A0A8H6J917_9PEZI|nr:hypothetical protein CMUS01_13817 [Colletotrichum musicola]
METLYAWMVKLKGVASISNNEQKSAAREEYEKTVNEWSEDFLKVIAKTAISAFYATFEAKFHESDNPSISEISVEIPTCHGCDLPRHLLVNCFYCFLEEAYEGWRPSNDIMKKVTERLKADDDLADRVKKIRE